MDLIAPQHQSGTAQVTHRDRRETERAAAEQSFYQETAKHQQRLERMERELGGEHGLGAKRQRATLQPRKDVGPTCAGIPSDEYAAGPDGREESPGRYPPAERSGGARIGSYGGGAELGGLTRGASSDRPSLLRQVALDVESAVVGWMTHTWELDGPDDLPPCSLRDMVKEVETQIKAGAETAATRELDSILRGSGIPSGSQILSAIGHLKRSDRRVPRGPLTPEEARLALHLLEDEPDRYRRMAGKKLVPYLLALLEREGHD